MNQDNFDDGFFLVSRSVIDSEVFKKEKWLKFFIWCLSKARFKPGSVEIQTGKSTTIVKLERGQFIFGRRSAAKKLSFPLSTCRNLLEIFSKRGILDTHADTHYTVVTIVNFDSYQKQENYKGHTKGQAKDNQRTGKGQPKDTNKNVKNVNNDEKCEEERTELFSKAFEKWWLSYPKRAGRRIGKKDAKKKFLKIPQSEWENMKTATKNYKTSLVESGLSPSDAHRFLNETWKEYIEKADKSSNGQANDNGSAKAEQAIEETKRQLDED